MQNLVKSVEQLGAKVAEIVNPIIQQNKELAQRVEQLEKQAAETPKPEPICLEGLKNEVINWAQEKVSEEVKSCVDALVLPALEKMPTPNPVPTLSEVVDSLDLTPAIAEQVKKPISDALNELEKSIQDLVKESVAKIKIPEPEKPEHGKDGKDALQLEIMPSIDQDKSYDRGTYAIHLGGLFRAYQRTQGMAGWECIVNGVASVEPVFHGKLLTLKTVMSDGTESSAELTIPYPEYKGVFNPDGEYTKGDSVTWDGSLWIALCDSPAGNDPKRSDNWQLAVKRGDTGKGLYRIARDNGFKGTEKDLLEHVIKGEVPSNIVRL